MSNKNYKKIWFLLGLGSQLQFIASLSISEAMVLVAAPIMLFSEYQWMRRTRVNVFFTVSALLVFGCAMACIANRTEFQYAVRGFATTILLLFSVVVAHRLFRMDMNGYKWYFVGVAISLFLCTFVFQRFGELEAYGGGAEGLDAAESIMSSPIFWIQRLSAFMSLPSIGWYLSVPLWLSSCAPVFMAIFSMLTSSSGRSAALCSLAACAAVVTGRKHRSSMQQIGRLFWFYLFVGLLLILLFNTAYRYAAENGILTEEARNKYEAQTARGKDVLSVIMGGRSDSFVGLLACRDNPIFGYGPWAIDKKGYMAEFMRKYGTYEDCENLIKSEMRRARLNAPPRLIQCHSYIVEFWVWYGIFGLLYWVYAIFVFVRYVRQDIAAVPQWFFWLAAGMPGMFWGIFFSPLTNRIGVVLFIVACLMARAVRKGWHHMPNEMIDEIIKVERR